MYAQGTTTMVAAPTTYAGGVQYATAAPQYTTAAPAVQYAQAPVTYAAPAVETVAAPVQYAAAPMMTYAAPAVETVAAPVQYAAPAQYTSRPSLNVQQSVTTEGIPNPQQISVQQAQYEKALDKQLADGVATLEKEREIEKKMLQFSADKEIALQANVIQERLVEQLSLVDEKATIAILELKKAAVERKLQLSAQAMNLTLSYEERALQVEWQTKRGEFEGKLAAQNQKLQDQINKIEAAADMGTGYAGTAGAVTISGTGFSKMALPSTGAPQGFEGNFRYVPA